MNQVTYVEIYPTALENIEIAEKHISHELAHIIEYTLGKSEHVFDKWSQALAKDHYRKVSWYADRDGEDIAETVAFYLKYDAGNFDNFNSRENFKHRFEILDDIFLAVDIDIEELRRTLKQRKTKANAGGFLILSTGLGVGWLYYDN